MSRIMPLAITAALLLLAVSTITHIVIAQEARLISSCSVPNTVALTFDHGPWIYAQEVSDALTAAGATGTFFVNGNNYDCIYNPDAAARVLYYVQQGHQIASETWSNTDLTTLSSDQINAEMARVDEAIQKITGVNPAFVRPPYGSTNDVVNQIAFNRHQSIVLWDFDSGDSTGSTPEQSEAAYDALIAGRPSNILALNHETQETTVHLVLPYAIQKLQAAGYRLVSLADCVGMSPYQSVQAPGTRDSTWTCS